MCQKIAWKGGHKGDCKILKDLGAGKSSVTGLAAITDSRVKVIEDDLNAWQKANGANASGAGSKHALELIKAYGQNSDICFSPPLADKPFRQALITISRIFFIHTLQLLSEESKSQLGLRLSVIPPYSDKFDGFSAKIVEDPAGQSAHTYEWLFRTIASQLEGLGDDRTVRRWAVLGRVGVQLWEEQTAVERMLARAQQVEEENDENYDSDEETGGHKCCGGNHEH
ncbi:hypothetical protein P7C70_g7498, partial [Phenoliferia sp. Uapishka_3]